MTIVGALLVSPEVKRYRERALVDLPLAHDASPAAALTAMRPANRLFAKEPRVGHKLATAARANDVLATDPHQRPLTAILPAFGQIDLTTADTPPAVTAVGHTVVQHLLLITNGLSPRVRYQVPK